MYKCLGCGRKIEVDIASATKIICPSCGYRVLEKERPKVVKMVESV
ncbi:MAG: DNA-directed RNA polymerase subunit P [Candidatus Aenigmarchaeota archaeon]|nr:DNA-directed RNA polymerase subunit P [Candidatus Aenigmarchaeota archaeon]